MARFMPDWLVNVTQPRELPTLREYLIENKRSKTYENITQHDNHTAITVTMKLGHSSAGMYDAFEGKGAYASVYSEAFNLLFKPSPPIEKMLQE